MFVVVVIGKNILNNRNNRPTTKVKNPATIAPQEVIPPRLHNAIRKAEKAPIVHACARDVKVC
jgi:hypothetical protein